MFYPWAFLIDISSFRNFWFFCLQNSSINSRIDLLKFRSSTSKFSVSKFRDPYRKPLISRYNSIVLLLKNVYKCLHYPIWLWGKLPSLSFEETVQDFPLLNQKVSSMYRSENATDSFSNQFLTAPTVRIESYLHAPRGTVLSPVEFNLYVNTLQHENDPPTKLLQYDQELKMSSSFLKKLLSFSLHHRCCQTEAIIISERPHEMS